MDRNLSCEIQNCSSLSRKFCISHQIALCDQHIIPHMTKMPPKHLIVSRFAQLSSDEIEFIKRMKSKFTQKYKQQARIQWEIIDIQHLISFEEDTKRYINDGIRPEIHEWFDQKTTDIQRCFKFLIEFQEKQIFSKRKNILYMFQEILSGINIIIRQKGCFQHSQYFLVEYVYFLKRRNSLNQAFLLNILSKQWKLGVKFLKNDLNYIHNNPELVRHHYINTMKTKEKENFLLCLLSLGTNQQMQKLFNIVLLSKTEPAIEIASSFCITILSKRKFDLTKKKLKGIRIPKAELMSVDLSFSNLQGANLQGVSLLNANLMNTKLKNCNLKKIKLQEGTSFQHPSQCTAIGISPCGRYLASGCWNSTLYYWDLQTNELEFCIEDPIQVEEKKNGYLLECLYRYLQIENPQIQQDCLQENSNINPFLSLSFFSNGKYLSCGRCIGIFILDLQNIEKRIVFQQQFLVIFIQYIKNQDLIAWASWPFCVKIGNIQDQNIKYICQYKISFPNTFCFDSEKDRLIFARSSKVICYYIQEQKQQELYYLSGRKIYCIFIYKKYLLTGCKMNKCLLYKLNNDEIYKEFSHPSMVRKCALYQNQNSELILIVCTQNSGIIIWNVELQTKLRVISCNIVSVWDVCISEDGRTIAISEIFNSNLKVFQLQKLYHQKKQNIKQIPEILLYSPLGKFVCTAQPKNGIQLHDSETGKLQHVFSYPQQEILQFIFSQDETKLVTGSKSGLLIEWNLQDHKIEKKVNLPR